MSDVEFYGKGLVVGGVLLALSLVLYLILVLLTGKTIIVGTLLTLTQVAVGIITVVITLVVVAVGIRIIASRVEEAMAEIDSKLQSIRVLLSKASKKVGAEMLTLISGILCLLAQGMLVQSLVLKITISAILIIWLYLASQLVSRDRRSDKIIGLFFYVVPFAGCVVLAGELRGWTTLWNDAIALPVTQLILIFLAVLSVVFGLVYSFYRQRE